MTIILLMGETGKYDDYREWVVCAYKKGDVRVQLHMENAQNRADEFVQKRPTERTPIPLGVAEKKYYREFDAKFFCDRNGISYFVRETELID